MRRLLPAVLLLAATAGSAAAQGLEDYDYENLALSGFGLDYGRIWPSKVDPTGAYTLRLDMGFLGPGVRVSPALSYWTSTLRQAEMQRLVDSLNRLKTSAGGGAPFEVEDLGVIHWSNLSLTIDLQGVWRTPLGLNPFAGVGLGLHALNGRGEAIRDTFVEDLLDTITLGAAVMGGLEFQPLPRLRLYAEGRYTLVSDVHFGGINIGALILLPQATEARQP
jgi:opacity protein-like surface antigen